MLKFFLVATTLLGVISSKSLLSYHRQQVPDNAQIIFVKDGRGFWDFVGNWIQQSEWFPIELNVPDTFNGIGNGVYGFFNGLVQRIPFINRSNQTKIVFVPTRDGYKPSDTKPNDKFQQIVDYEIFTYP